MNFTVIDFETANSKRASACALGIVKVVEGKIVEKSSWLIRPDDMRFDGMNIAIHGIRPEQVMYEPEFNELYQEIFKEKLEGQLVIAHNASFDMSVLRKSLDLYNLSYPSFDYLCSVKVAQKTWPDLFNHKLDTISTFLNFKFKHHDALDDCLACANVMIKACEEKGVDSPLKLANVLNMQTGRVYSGGYKACSINKK
jgi:DNA polymerase-3 subunit epsilon